MVIFVNMNVVMVNVNFVPSSVFLILSLYVQQTPIFHTKTLHFLFLSSSCFTNQANTSNLLLSCVAPLASDPIFLFFYCPHFSPFFYFLFIFHFFFNLFSFLLFLLTFCIFQFLFLFIYFLSPTSASDSMQNTSPFF